MSENCIVCSPRTGSYYFLKQFAEQNDLVNGNEWFGRNKAVDHSKPSELETTTVDINWNVNEDLLTEDEVEKRLKHLENFHAPYVVKCMPLQLTNTPTQESLGYKERIAITAKILKENFSKLIWFQQPDKVSHFCFELTAMACSHVDYPRRREFCTYDSDFRKTPEDDTFTAPPQKFQKWVYREDFTNHLMSKLDHVVVSYDDIDKTGVIPYPDYSRIFTNYEEIVKWCSPYMK